MKLAAWWLSLVMVGGLMWFLTYQPYSAITLPIVWFGWIALALFFLRCRKCGLPISIGYDPSYPPLPYFPRLPSPHCSKCGEPVG